MNMLGDFFHHDIVCFSKYLFLKLDKFNGTENKGIVFLLRRLLFFFVVVVLLMSHF